MNQKSPYRFHTRVIHTAQSAQDWQGATLAPIFQTASHQHATAEDLSDTFAGKKADHIYMRLTNPTNRILEEKLAALEGGMGAVVMSSGMAAIANTCMALLRAGDEFVTGNSLFMSTYLLFANVFKKYGLTARMVESTDNDAIEKAINSKTRFVYLETIGNPKMDIPDLSRAAEIAHGNGIPLIVDNTMATPFLCCPLEIGADVVIHSTTKYLSGHGNAVGGAVIDGGKFNWSDERFPDFKPFIDRKGPLALLDKIWREHHINFGTTQAPMHSYLTMIGLDTLALRMERHMTNALEVAHFLNERPEVSWVNYPGLDDHPSHAVALKQFEGRGFGGMLAFGLKDQETCFLFIDNLQLIYHLANLGDCKTLVIHPYSSQYVSFDDPTRERLSISSDLIRLSVGIEAVEDICEDLGQALDGGKMSEYIEHDQNGISVGIVKKQFFTFAEPPHEMVLENGVTFGPVTIAYETYGNLSPNRDNAILVLHALSGDSHVAGYYSEDDTKPGWWDIMVGPEKGIDTNKYFVVCPNILGSCMGSTGPASINPKTQKSFGLDFPLVTIGDMVKAQKVLLDHLGIEKLFSVVGGSIGGLQVLEWCLRYPEMVVSAIPLATTMKHSALAIAFNEVARQAIMADPNWNNGDYYSGLKPDLGLAVARMIGHVTYLSDESMRIKFGRRLQDKSDFSFNFNADFQVESYLRNQGKKFVERFDANSFLYITKAADYYDMEMQHDSGSAVKAFSKARSRFLVVSFTSDWLYPTYQSKVMVQAMKKNGLDVSFCEIEAEWGHDAFLLPSERLSALIRGFLERVYHETTK